MVCYSSPCITLNQNKPISFCKECHNSKHQRLREKNDHVFQEYIEDIWKLDQRTRSFLTTTIINLLKEVPIIESRKSLDFMEQSMKKNTASASAILNNNTNNTNSNNNNSANNTNNNNNNNVNNSNSTNPLSSGLAPHISSVNLGNNLTTPKGDITSLIGVGLIGALNTNGFSNTSTLASSLFSTGSLLEESNFNKRLLSRFACYLIYSLIKPVENQDIVIVSL